ncbi:MAG: RNA polymerase sigma factor [Thermoleophilaceae bacterium]
MSLPPFQALLDVNRADVYRFLVASVGPSEADDCFQETCIAALRAYPRLERATNLRAWLFRIAERKAIDAHRARGRRAVPVEAVPERATGDGLPDGNGEPGLWAAVRRLPSKQRTAVVCRSALGMPYPQLAQLLECSEDAARRNVHEGLRRLREEWER